MTPLEINKRIRELKGCKISKWGRCDCENNSHKKWDGDEKWPILIDKNWAENISDAWELFEEMPVGTTIQKCNSGIEPFYSVGWDEFIDKEFSGEAGKASEAICLAWIKWKENNPELMNKGEL